MKIPTKKEIAIDAAWLMFRGVLSSINYLVVIVPILLLFFVLLGVTMLTKGVMSFLDYTGDKLYFFADGPIGYYERVVKSIKVLMRYKEWKNERQ